MRYGLHRQKKGNVQDILYIGAMLFAVAIAIIVIYHVWTQISTPINTAITNTLPEGETAINISTVNDKVLGAVNVFDAMYPFFMVGLFIFVLISAFAIKSHPAFFFIGIIILIVFIFISVIFSNVYQDVIESEGLASAASNFEITNLFMQYLPWVILIISIIVFIAIWAKPPSTAEI